MKFDINAARSAGYSDDEIADYLAKENNFDLEGALKSGYSASEVVGFLSGGASAAPAPAPAPAADTGDDMARMLARNPAPKRPSRSMSDAAKDAGITLLKGAIGLPESFVGLADIAAQGRIGKFLEEQGYRPGEAKQILDSYLSEAQKAANREVQQADGFVPTVKAALQNPSTIATAVGESLPQMLGGAGVARGVMRVAPKVAPLVAGAIGEGALGAGSAASQIRGESKDGLLTPEQSAAALASGVGTAALGIAGGKVAQRFGFDDVETMLARGSSVGPAKSVADFTKRVAAAGFSEGVLEEMPQSAQEKLWENYALGKPLTEGVGAAAGMGLVTGAAMGAAGGGGGAISSRLQTSERQVARELSDALEGGQFTELGIDQAVADRLRTESVTGNITPAATTLNFTAPDSPTSQAGLTPITVPVPSAAAGTDAALAAVSAGQSLPATVGAGQQTAGLARPFNRATDQDLLSRTEAAVAAKGDNNAAAEPTQQWFGRKGDGYATEADALQAIAGRQRMFKDLDWKVELMPSGKFRLAGYEQNVQVPTEASTATAATGGLPAAGAATGAVEAAGLTSRPIAAPITAAQPIEATNVAPTAQAVQSIPQGQETPAASAKQPGDLNLPQWPLPDAVFNELSRAPGSANARAAVQGHLNNLVASGLMPAAPKLGTPDADAEATVNVLGNLFGDTTGIGGRVVAYSNPGGENGFSMRGIAFVNTAPDTDVSAPRTTLHEIRHVVERIAQADTKAGLTNTPAQQFTASIDSIFDDMTDAGKRAYVENFLHKEDLDGITDPAEREAAVQKFMASPLLRSEMGADFLGNRAQDRAFLIDLAKADPKGFEGFVQKWLAVIDNLLAKLKGSKTQDRKESAKVDQYVRDLNKAKMVARDALIAFRKGNLAEMAAQQEQVQQPAAKTQQTVTKDEMVVDGVAYSARQRNLVDIPTVDFADLVGKKVFGIKADLTDAGRSYTGIDGSQLEFPVEMMGGPNYVRLPENAKANVIWAVRGGAVLTKIMEQVNKSDYVLVHAMNGNSHLTNSTISTAYLQTVEAYLRDGKISQDNIKALDEIVRSPKNKSSLTDFPGFESPEIYSYIDGLSFDQRGALAALLEKKEAQTHGLPSLDRFRRETLDPDFAGYRQGDAMLVLEVDKKNPTVKLGEEGTKLHPSYPLGLRGKVIGKLSKGINYELIFRDYFQNDVPSFKNGEAGAWYAFDRKMPIQEITPEIANSVSPGGYKSIKTARQAEAALALANGNWLQSGRTKAMGGVSVQEFVDALQANEGAAALTLYTSAEVKAGIRDKTFTVYQLGTEGGDKGLQIFFGLKRGAPWYKDMIDGVGDNEVEVVSVTNNEPGAPGIGIPAIITKAIQEGATVLDAFAVKSKRFPDGFLPEMYGQFGFEEIGRIPFDPSYYNDTQMADLKAFWSKGGWNEADGYPDVVAMRWKGKDEDRAATVERYVRTGETGVPAGSPRHLRAAAGDAGGQRDRTGDQARGDRGRDRGQARGDQGASNAASVVSRAYGSIQELATLSDGDIRNLGLDQAEVQRLRDNLEGVRFSIRSTEPAGGSSAGRDQGDAIKVEGAIHYGRAGGLSVLSAASFGTGIKGAEQQRLSQPGVDPRIKRRVYFYLPVPGGVPAPEIGLGANVYTASLSNLYDPSAGTRRFPADANAFETAILDAGFRGYINREQGTAVVLDSNVPVKFIGNISEQNVIPRRIERVVAKASTRQEGEELVRRPSNNELSSIIRARAKLVEAAPSFRLQFGEARIKSEDADAANAVLADVGSDFRFSKRQAETIEVGGIDLPLNDDGTVTLYHHTSKESAKLIRQSGILRAKAEPDVYMTTRRETDTGYGDIAVALRVPPDRLMLDDEFPDGRADFRMDVGRPGGSIRVKVEPDAGDIMFSRRQPAAVEQDPELITIFEGLQNGRGLKAVRAKEAAAEHPLGDAIQKVHNDFYDILERLESAGLMSINC